MNPTCEKPNCGKEMIRSKKKPYLFYCPENMNDPNHKSFKRDENQPTLHPTPGIWDRIEDTQKQILLALDEIKNKLNGQ